MISAEPPFHCSADPGAATRAPPGLEAVPEARGPREAGEGPGTAGRVPGSEPHFFVYEGRIVHGGIE